MKIISGLLVLIFAILAGTSVVSAVTNIDSTNRWAWNDNKGWIEFYSPNTTEVTDEKIEGYAIFHPDTTDYVSFDCATTPSGNLCASSGGPSDYFVSNDGNGELAGFAWNDTIGWISFNCSNHGGTFCADTSDYGVTIETAGPDTGDFSGWAWNDVVGWISFNCINQGAGFCSGTSNYRVKTTWNQNAVVVSTGFLISNTFDTGVAEGAAFNSIIWNGTFGEPGNAVKFQLATANCANGADDPNNEDAVGVFCDNNAGWGGAKTSGDGAFVGDGGFTTTFYEPVGPGIPAQIVVANHLNKSYYRYKMTLEKGDGNTISPVVNSVIINWSQ